MEKQFKLTLYKYPYEITEDDNIIESADHLVIDNDQSTSASNKNHKWFWPKLIHINFAGEDYYVNQDELQEALDKVK